MRRITTTDDYTAVEHEEDGPYSRVEIRYAPIATNIRIGALRLDVTVHGVEIMCLDDTFRIAVNGKVVA